MRERIKLLWNIGEKCVTMWLIHLENEYWEQDHIIDNLQDFIINVTWSDSSSSDEGLNSDAGESGDLSGIEYLESEFDYESD